MHKHTSRTTIYWAKSGTAVRSASVLITAHRPACAAGSGVRPGWPRIQNRVLCGRRSRLRCPIGQQGLRIVIRLLYRHPCEGLAVELGPSRQQRRLPVSPAVGVARRSDRYRHAPAIRSATNGAPSLVPPADGGASRRPDRLPARVQCAAGRSVHERRCRPCLRAGPRGICYRRLNRTVGGRQGPRVRTRSRWCPARVEEDSVPGWRGPRQPGTGCGPRPSRTGSLACCGPPGRSASGLTSARVLSHPRAEPGKPGALAPNARRVAACGQGR